MEVDLTGVPAGGGEIDPGRPEAGADRRVSGQLPARAKPQTAVCRLQDEWLGKPPRVGCKPDQRWQRQHCGLEIGVTGGGEDLLQELRESLKRQLSGAEEVVEPGNGRDPVVFVDSIQGCCNRETFVHGHNLGRQILHWLFFLIRTVSSS